MDSNYLKYNFKKFKKQDFNEQFGLGHGILSNCLEALFSQMLNIHWDIARYVDTSAMEIYTVFDIPHDSDESCEFHVFVVNDIAVAAIHRYGDRSDWQSNILDKVLFKQLAQEIQSKWLDEELAKVEEGQISALGKLGNFYLKFLDKNETCFLVESPKWSYFCSIEENHRAFYMQDNQEFALIDKIIKFANRKASHSDDGDRNDVIIVLAGKEVVVDANRIIFELVKGEADIPAVYQYLDEQIKKKKAVSAD